jgi:hypothetical protein
VVDVVAIENSLWIVAIIVLALGFGYVVANARQDSERP